jgi:hypothetical protein
MMKITLKKIDWDTDTDNMWVLESLPEEWVFLIPESELEDYELDKSISIGYIEQVVKGFKEELEEKFYQNINGFEIELSWECFPFQS